MNPFQKLAYEIRRGQVLREKTATRYDLRGYSSPLEGEGVPTDPEALEEYLADSRMQTPYDSDVNSRLSASMLHNTRANMDPYVSFPGQEPVNLSREDLEKALSIYGQQSQEMLDSDSYSPEDLEIMKQQMQAFQNQGRHLLDDPSFSAARLEHE